MNTNITTHNSFKKENEGRRLSLNGATTSSPLVCWDFEYIIKFYNFVRKTLSLRKPSDQANSGSFKIQTAPRKKALHH